ncbi:hypothetical protein [Vitreoscilla massiliensis]|nr:hypothetical protein [Vitreoscilla massiliensis]
MDNGLSRWRFDTVHPSDLQAAYNGYLNSGKWQSDGTACRH